MSKQPDGEIITYTRVSVPRSRDDLTFEWQGGPVARVYRGNMGFDPHGVLSDHNPRVGAVLRYGPFRVRCIASTRDYFDLERQ